MNEAKKNEILKLLEGLTYHEIDDILDHVRFESQRRCRLQPSSEKFVVEE